MTGERQRRNPITGFWENVPPPRWVSVFHAVAYLVMATAGVLTLTEPPLFLRVGFGGALTVYWAWLLILGGLAGVPAALTGLFVLERVAVLSTGTAIAMYGVAVIELDLVSDAELAYQSLLNLALLVLIITRAIRVWHGVRDPERYSNYKPIDPTTI